MFHIVANRLAECIEQHLSDNERKDSKSNVSQRPSSIQSSQHQNDLHDNVHKQEQGAEDVDHDEDANGVLGSKASPALECQEGDGEGDEEHGDTASTEQPDGKRGAVLVQLETNEPVDHQADARRGNQTHLHGDEVWVCAASRRHDAGVDDQRAHRQKGISVEERSDLLPSCFTNQPVFSHQALVFFPMTKPTNRGEFTPHMQYHDDQHYESQDVRESGCAFEDDGVGDLDGARVAVGLGEVSAGDGRGRSHDGA